MPLPIPKSEEKEKEFISRCMSDEIMIKEYPNQDQRLAVCHSQYKKKNDQIEEELENAYRIDFFDNNKQGILSERFEKTEEGYLKGRSIVTNVGVFTYLLPNGSTQRELRLPEEVFSIDSIESLKMCPLTNDHPKESVKIDNIKKLQVGYLGDNIITDSYHVSAPIIITNEKTIDDIRADKKQLSCGYTVDLEYKSGMWMGMPYDAIQRNIRYNHVAVVKKGRAGDAVQIKLDGIENIAYSNYKKEDENIMSLKTIKIDGVDYEAEADFIKHYQKIDFLNKELQEKIDSLTETFNSDKSKHEAEKDQLKDEIDNLKKKVDEAEKELPQAIQQAVNDRLVIIGAGEIAGAEIKEDMDDFSAKKEILKKLYPNSVEKIDSSDELYVNARFDIALETLQERQEEKKELDEELKKDSIANSKEEKVDSAKARESMVQSIKDLWKKNLKEEN